MDMVTVALIMAFLCPGAALQEFLWKHFAKKPIVVVSSNFANLEEKLMFILRLDQPKVIIDAKSVHILKGFGGYIVIEPNSTTVSSTMDSLKYRIDSRSNFLVILSENITEDDSKSLLKTLFQFYIYNVVLYVNWSNFVTWYPFNSTETDLVAVTGSVHPYDNKIPENLKNYPFRVSWKYAGVAIKNPDDKSDPGYNIRLVDTIAEKINASLIYLKENLVFIEHGERTRRNLSEDMTRRSIDVAFLTSTVPEATPETEMTITYTESNCYFVLPPRRKIVSSMDTLVIFSTVVWSLIFAAIIAMTLLLKVISGWSLETSLFQIISLTLQLSMPRIPNSTQTRLVFTIFLFCVSNLNWIYVSQLSGVLSNPSYEPKLATIDELAHSSKKLRIGEEWVPVLESLNHTNVLKRRIGADVKMNMREELSDFLQRLDYGMIFSTRRLLFLKDFQKLEIVPEKVTSVHSYLLVRRGFPFLERINRLVFGAVEGGLMSKWLYESQVHVRKGTIWDYEEVEGRLDMDRILSAVVLLGLGIAASIVVFVLELTCT